MRAAPKRRGPADWKRYTVAVRRAQRRRRRPHPHVLLTLAVSGLFALVMLGAVLQTGAAITAGVATFFSDVGEQLSQLGEGQLDIGGGQTTTIGVEPIVEGLPEFTREPRLLLQGRVPMFALGEGRLVEISLNGRSIGLQPIDAEGRFLMTLELAEGPNEIATTLMVNDVPFATSARTVTLDVTKPALTVTNPSADTEDLVGPDVTVAGRSEPFAIVTVNGRRVLVAPDGSFSDTITVPSGSLELTVVARDRAGNETQTRLVVIVRDQATVVPLTLGVTLDRTIVKPGESIIAEVVAMEDGQPRAGLFVTLQVGVITVANGVTDGTGRVRIGFSAPTHEAEDVAVLALGGGAVGRATFSVVR